MKMIILPLAFYIGIRSTGDNELFILHIKNMTLPLTLRYIVT